MPWRPCAPLASRSQRKQSERTTCNLTICFPPPTAACTPAGSAWAQLQLPPLVQSPTSHHGFCSTADQPPPPLPVGPWAGMDRGTHRAHPSLLGQGVPCHPRLIRCSTRYRGWGRCQQAQASLGRSEYVAAPAPQAQDQPLTWASLEKRPQPLLLPQNALGMKAAQARLNGWPRIREQTHLAAGAEGPGGLR